MRAGRLRNRVTILRRIDSNDPSGGHSQAWEEVGSMWAGIEYLGGREYFEAGAAKGEVDVRIVARSGPEIRVSDRIQYRKRLFDVQSVPLDATGRGREVRVMCKEYVA